MKGHQKGGLSEATRHQRCRRELEVETLAGMMKYLSSVGCWPLLASGAY